MIIQGGICIHKGATGSRLR